MGPIDPADRELDPWEQEVRALYRVLKTTKGLVTTDELRWGIERLDREDYRHLGYFERWVRSLEMNLIEKSILTRDELERKWRGD